MQKLFTTIDDYPAMMAPASKNPGDVSKVHMLQFSSKCTLFISLLQT